MWIGLCWLTAACVSISALSYNSVVGFLLSCIVALNLPRIYQFGLDHLDFEESAKWFSWEEDEEE